MPFGRFEICEALEFRNWTAVQTWIRTVARDASVELRDDYLEPFADQGKKSGHGNLCLKEYFATNAHRLYNNAVWRAEDICHGVTTNHVRPADKRGWSIRKHYTRFILEALALDIAYRAHPRVNTLTNRRYAMDLVRLICIMYELTEAICHNYWKPEPEDWASDDSDIAYTD